MVIPISDWEEIIKTHPDIDLMLQPQTDVPKNTMKDFRGCISSETADKLNTLRPGSWHTNQSLKFKCTNVFRWFYELRNLIIKKAGTTFYFCPAYLF